MTAPFSKIAESVISELYSKGSDEPFKLHDLHLALKVNDITSERAIERNLRLLLELDYIKKSENNTFKFSKRAGIIIDWIKDENKKKVTQQKEA